MLSILLFRQGLFLSLNPKLIIWLGWMANELQGPTCLYPFNTGIIDACTQTQLFLGGGGQNPGPHACAANSSPTEDLPSPCTPYSLMGPDKICIIIEACGSLGPQTPGREASRLRLCGPSPSSLTLSPFPQDVKVPEICYLDLPNVKVFSWF